MHFPESGLTLLQYEVVTGPLPPLEAADALICTRETIYNVSSKYGLRATFAPKLYANSCECLRHGRIPPFDSDPQVVARRTRTSLCTILALLHRLRAATNASHRR